MDAFYNKHILPETREHIIQAVKGRSFNIIGLFYNKIWHHHEYKVNHGKLKNIYKVLKIRDEKR